MRVDVVKTGKPSLAEGPVMDPERREGSIRLERKHPLAIRWMHWINFPVLFTMIWSGILIYWNDSDNAYRHPHAIYRIGLGHFTLLPLLSRLVLQVLHVPYHVTEGPGLPLLLHVDLRTQRHCLRALTSRSPASGDSSFRSGAACATPSRSRSSTCTCARACRQQTKYNGAQRIAYTSVHPDGRRHAAHRPRHLQTDAGALAHLHCLAATRWRAGFTSGSR